MTFLEGILKLQSFKNSIGEESISDSKQRKYGNTAE